MKPTLANLAALVLTVAIAVTALVSVIAPIANQVHQLWR